MNSWLPLPGDTPFPLENLPYGVFTAPDGGRRVGVAIGDHVLDAAPLARARQSDFTPLLYGRTLNQLLAAGPALWPTPLHSRNRLASAMTTCGGSSRPRW